MVEPAFICLPEWHRTLGPEVGRLCRLANYGPDPEQQLGLDATFALTAVGRSAASTVVLLGSRQNFKTGEIKQIELGWLFVTGERLVVHSAHEFDTVRETYRDMKEIIDGAPLLRKRIRAMRDTPADMSIETVTGARLVFKTRTAGAGVGKSPRKIVLDEGYALKPEHMSALRFSISAQPDPQVIVGSSAAHEESDVLRTFVKRGRAGRDPRLAYFEWCVREELSKLCRTGEACSHVFGEVEGCALDDLDVLREANPQLGKRLREQTIRDERAECVTFELAAKFARERAGVHDAPVADAHDPVLTPVREAWPGLKDEASQIAGTVAIGVDVNPEATRAAVSVYGLRADGVGHGEVIEDRVGTAGAVDRLVELSDTWSPAALVLDPSGPAGRFLKALKAVRLDDGRPRFVTVTSADDETPVDDDQTRILLVSGTAYAQACGAWADDVTNGRLVHIGQKQLDDALSGAKTRPLTDSWAWSRKSSSVNIAPLVSLTLARDGFAAFGGDEGEVDAWVLSV